MSIIPVSVSQVIEAFEKLPGVGPKSAARLVFYLLNTPESYVLDFSKKLAELKKNTKTCQKCFSVCEDELCGICSDVGRKKDLVCVVEKVVDVLALENMGGFKGVYHVLGGLINPLEHVGPEDLKIVELINRLLEDGVKEVIMAMSPTMEGEATALYLKRKIEEQGIEIKISRIGSGLPMGADLGFADQVTLNRALDGRREM